jgi:hypothetical protein
MAERTERRKDCSHQFCGYEFHASLPEDLLLITGNPNARSTPPNDIVMKTVAGQGI